ncbi:MAG: exodeoxyribonuclease VII large subunit [Clostridia bacterium]|nr:exodeoxyribonuclease VII large subunit [Clostridia bacterium]
MNPNEQAFSVTQLNEYVKMLIDSDEILQTAAVCGEISNFKHHYATGHLYFTLKDERSSVKCVMFARDAARLKFEPENGMTVTAWGRVSVFPRDGAYQLYVGFMSPSGLGEQFYAFEMLKQKLASEGLFDAARKKMIPKFPKKIGIITSPTGAAVRDLYNVLTRRWPIVEIELFPALVQGTGAASSLRKGIEYFDSKDDIDVVIIGRGGGSGEDLSAFNDEALARSIAASKIPVISAVGHEVDVSISDFVADLRAPTPSAAAELAVPDMGEYNAILSSHLGRIKGIVSRRIEFGESRLKTLSESSVLKSPEKYFDIKFTELDYLAERLVDKYDDIIKANGSKFSSLVAKLEALSPLSVLSRGYSITNKGDKAVSSVAEISSGDDLVLVFNDGKVDVKVK